MRYVLLVLLPLASIGCGSDRPDGGAATGGDGGGGSGAPNGALSLEVYRTQEQTCPHASLLIEIGNVKAAPRIVVQDGQDGAALSCSVIPSGMDFAASGHLQQGTKDFGFSGLVTDGTSALGAVSFVDPASGTLFESGMPCVFQFAPGTDQGISAGHVHVQFDCADLVSQADPTVSCSSRYGYVLLDSCEGSPAM